MLRPSITVGAVALAILGGTLYGLSPMTVWLTMVMVLVVGWAARGLQGVERRRVIGVVTLAVVLRALAILAIAWHNDPAKQSFSTLFGDAVYAIRSSLWIRNTYLGVPIFPRDYLEAFDTDYGHTSYHTLLAVAQVLVGPSPYGVHVLSAALYLVGVIALFRTVRRAYGPTPALIGLVVILFLPSLFVWSILPLKESAYFFCLAISTSAVVSFRYCRTWTGVVSLVIVVALTLAATNSLRNAGLVIAIGGLATGLVAALATRWRVVLILLLVTLPVVAMRTIDRPAVRDQVRAVMVEALNRHLAQSNAPGTGYTLVELELERGFREPDTMTFDEGVRFFANSVAAFVLMPKPWAPRSLGAILIAPQQLVWYALVIFALVGVVAGLGRDRLLTCLLGGNVIVGASVIAPVSGNVGTLIRHRDMVVPFVVWLAGLGLLATMNRLGADRRQRRDPQDG